jgi:hypothetical protein
MVNTKHDATSYENCSCEHETFNSNNLYKAYKKTKKNSDWKASVQKYEMRFLPEISETYKSIKNRTFELSDGSEFILKERGKTRLITGEHIRDRVVKSCLCTEELIPVIKKYLIHDNGASLEGKGIGFTRDRFERHLRRFYSKHGSNDGYILLIDFSKYFDNIRHDYFLKIFEEIGIKNDALWVLEKAIEKSRVDVSYMSDEQYSVCMQELFNSLEYQNIDKALCVGGKIMDKHLNIGDQVAQVAGIAYPKDLDNYIKIVKGVKLYGRYMDDSYVIHQDKNYLESLLKEIVEESTKIGITINAKKTRICKLSSCWRFLQIQYSLTETGRIIKKINPKRLTAMRRKMKKLAPVLYKKDFERLFTSWFNNHYKLMSRQQRTNMNNLYNELKGVNQCTT